MAKINTKNYYNILPPDKDLVDREQTWFKLFDKYQSFTEETELDLSNISQELQDDADNDENIDTANDAESVSESEFESESEQDKDFNLMKTADEAMKIIKQRVEQWPEKGLHLMLTSVPNKVKFNTWKKNNSFSQPKERDSKKVLNNDKIKIQQKISVKNKIVNKQQNGNGCCESSTSTHQTRITTMTIKRRIISSKITHDAVRGEMFQGAAAAAANDETVDSLDSLEYSPPPQKKKIVAPPKNAKQKSGTSVGEKENISLAKKKGSKKKQFENPSISTATSNIEHHPKKQKQSKPDKSKSRNVVVRDPSQQAGSRRTRSMDKIKMPLKKHNQFQNVTPALKKPLKRYPVTPYALSSLESPVQRSVLLNPPRKPQKRAKKSDNSQSKNDAVEGAAVAPAAAPPPSLKKSNHKKIKRTRLIIEDSDSDDNSQINNNSKSLKATSRNQTPSSSLKTTEENKQHSPESLNDSANFDAVDLIAHLDKNHKRKKTEIASTTTSQLSSKKIMPAKGNKTATADLTKLDDSAATKAMISQQDVLPNKPNLLEKTADFEFTKPLNVVPKKIKSKMAENDCHKQSNKKLSKKEPISILANLLLSTTTVRSLKPPATNIAASKENKKESNDKVVLTKKPAALKENTDNASNKVVLTKKADETDSEETRKRKTSKKINAKKLINQSDKLKEFNRNDLSLNNPNQLSASAQKASSDYFLAKATPFKPLAVVFPEKNVSFVKLDTSSSSSNKSVCVADENTTNRLTRTTTTTTMRNQRGAIFDDTTKSSSKNLSKSTRRRTQPILFYDPELPAESVHIDENDKTRLSIVAAKVGASDLSSVIGDKTISELKLKKSAKYFYLPPPSSRSNVAQDNDDTASLDDSDTDILDKIQSNRGLLIIKH